MTVDNNNNFNIDASVVSTTTTKKKKKNNNNNNNNSLSKFTFFLWGMIVVGNIASFVWMLVMSNAHLRAQVLELQVQNHKLYAQNEKIDMGVAYYLEVLFWMMLCFSLGKDIIDNLGDGKDTKDGIKKPRSDDDDDTKIEEKLRRESVIRSGGGGSGGGDGNTSHSSPKRKARAAVKPRRRGGGGGSGGGNTPHPSSKRQQARVKAAKWAELDKKRIADAVAKRN